MFFARIPNVLKMQWLWKSARDIRGNVNLGSLISAVKDKPRATMPFQA